MINFDNELVRKFINNEELGDYTRKELSDNVDFMRAVFSYSKDFKYFYSCSARLREDIDFVKGLITKSNDKDFISNIARCYLATANDEIDKLEVSITAEQKLPYEDGTEFRYINVTSYYDTKDKIAKEDADNPDFEAMLRDKFPRMMVSCNGNETILNYYARMMVAEVFDANENAFFKYLDEDFESIANYTDEYIAIRYIREYDSGLAEYLCDHFEPLRQVIFAIEKKRELDGDDSIHRLESVNDVVHEYMVKAGQERHEEELLYHVLRKGGLAVRYAYANHMPLDEIMDGMEDDEDIESLILNDRELKEAELNIKKIIALEVYSNERVDVDSMIRESIKRLKLGLSDDNPDNGTDE